MNYIMRVYKESKNYTFEPEGIWITFSVVLVLAVIHGSMSIPEIMAATTPASQFFEVLEALVLPLIWAGIGFPIGLFIRVAQDMRAEANEKI